MNLRTVKWAQCDTNPIQRTVRTAHLSVLMTAQLQYTIQHWTVLIIFPLTSGQPS